MNACHSQFLFVVCRWEAAVGGSTAFKQKNKKEQTEGKNDNREQIKNIKSSFAIYHMYFPF